MLLLCHLLKLEAGERLTLTTYLAICCGVRPNGFMGNFNRDSDSEVHFIAGVAQLLRGTHGSYRNSRVSRPLDGGSSADTTDTLCSRMMISGARIPARFCSQS